MNKKNANRVPRRNANPPPSPCFVRFVRRKGVFSADFPEKGEHPRERGRGSEHDTILIKSCQFISTPTTLLPPSPQETSFWGSRFCLSLEREKREGGGMKKLGTRREMIIRSFRPPRKLSKNGFPLSFSATIRPGKSLSFLHSFLDSFKIVETRVENETGCLRSVATRLYVGKR